MAVVQTLVDASTASLVSGLQGAIDGFNTSISAIAALFGEEFEQDITFQLDQMKLGFDLDLKNLKLAAIELQLNIDIQLKNIELEFNDLNLNLGVATLESIEPPQLGFFKWVDSVKWYILGFFGILSIFVLIDAYKIYNLSNDTDRFKYKQISDHF